MPLRRRVGRLLLVSLALGLLAGLPYLHGLGTSFTPLDDDAYVTENVHVRRGLTWEGAGWALTTFRQANWHPLTWLSHMADVSLFGVNARWHHLVNVLLHALNGALLFLALARLTGSVWPSAFVAALFGVHPLHVESVAWVAERKDLLAGLLFMAVLLTYERYARRGGTARLALVTVSLALGLMAKPMLVTVPFVLLLFDVWPLGRTAWTPPADGGSWEPVPWRALLVEKLPLLALSLASSVVTFLAQREGGGLIDFVLVPPAKRVLNAVVTYAVYLGQAAWPYDLSILYLHPQHGPSYLQVLGSLAVLVGLSWAAVASFRRAPYLAVGWFWYLGMLVPVIGLVQVGVQSRADRYTYLPLVGLFLAAAWGVSASCSRGRCRALALGFLGGAILLAMAAASRVQVGFWKDPGTLLARSLSVAPANPPLRNNLGMVLESQGRWQEAMAQYGEALRVWPDFPMAHNNLGGILLNTGYVSEAIRHFREALRVRPDFPEAHLNLGNALAFRGDADAAVAQYREAIRLRPDFAEAHYHLGRVLGRTGMGEESRRHLEEATRLQTHKAAP